MAAGRSGPNDNADAAVVSLREPDAGASVLELDWIWRGHLYRVAEVAVPGTPVAHGVGASDGIGWRGRELVLTLRDAADGLIVGRVTGALGPAHVAPKLAFHAFALPPDSAWLRGVRVDPNDGGEPMLGWSDLQVTATAIGIRRCARGIEGPEGGSSCYRWMAAQLWPSGTRPVVVPQTGVTLGTPPLEVVRAPDLAPAGFRVRVTIDPPTGERWTDGDQTPGEPSVQLWCEAPSATPPRAPTRLLPPTSRADFRPDERSFDAISVEGVRWVSDDPPLALVDVVDQQYWRYGTLPVLYEACIAEPALSLAYATSEVGPDHLWLLAGGNQDTELAPSLYQRGALLGRWPAGKFATFVPPPPVAEVAPVRAIPPSARPRTLPMPRAVAATADLTVTVGAPLAAHRAFVAGDRFVMFDAQGLALTGPADLAPSVRAPPPLPVSFFGWCQPRTSPVLAGVVVANLAEGLVAFTRDRLQRAWAVPFAPGLRAARSADAGVVAFATRPYGVGPKDVVALAATSGRELWRRTFAAVAEVDGIGPRVVVSDGQGLAAYDAESGRPLWRVASDGPPKDGPDFVIGDAANLAWIRHHEVRVLDATNGHARFRVAVEMYGGAAQVTFRDGVVYLLTLGANFVAIDLAAARVLWQTEPDADVAAAIASAHEGIDLDWQSPPDLGPIVATDHAIVACDTRKRLRVFARATGRERARHVITDGGCTDVVARELGARLQVLMQRGGYGYDVLDGGPIE